MARKGTLEIQIVGDAGPLQKTLGGLGGKVKRFAKVAAAAGATAAAGFGIKALKSASDLNETLSKTNVIFGDATDHVTGFADELADKFGLVKNETLEASARFGQYAQAAGKSDAVSAEFGTTMTKLAADAASFHNVPLDQAIQKIGSGLSGESEPLREWGVFLNAANVEAKALEMGLASAGGEISDQAKVMARAALVTEGLADAENDLERTQGSLANQVKRLRGRFENFAAEFGMRLIPFAQRGLAVFDDLLDTLKVFGRIIRAAATRNVQDAHAAFKDLDPALHDVAQVIFDVTGAVRDAWPQIKELATQAFETAREIGKRLLPILREVVTKGFKVVSATISTLIDHKEVLIPLIGAVAGGYAAYRVIQGTIAAITAAQKAWTAAQAAFNVVMSANPIGVVIVALAALTAGIVTAWKTSETFRNTVRRAWQGIRNATSTMVNFVINGVQGLVDEFLAAAGIIVEGAADAFGWMPGLGPKLRRASNQFQQFRSRVNRELDKVRKNVDINVRGHTNVFAMLREIQRATGRHVASRGAAGQQVGTGLSEFQHGGLFAPRSPVLGIIGEGPHREVAAPEPMLRQVVREESGGGQPIVVQVMLNEQQLGEALVSVNRRRRKRGLAVVG